MPFYERGQSAERASQANMGKFYDTNAPGISLNDSLLRGFSGSRFAVALRAKPHWLLTLYLPSTSFRTQASQLPLSEAYL